MSDSDLEKAASVFDKELDVFLSKKENLQRDLDTVRTIEKKIERVLAKSKEVDSERDDLKTRDILLKYYSSECTVHGAYILSVAIGVFAFLQVVDKINSLAPDIAFPIIAFVLSAFVTISILLLARMFYWGNLASLVTHVREMTIEEAEKTIDKNHDKITFLLRLHRACVEHFADDNRRLNYFVGVRRKNKMRLLYLVLFFLLAAITWLVRAAVL